MSTRRRNRKKNRIRKRAARALNRGTRASQRRAERLFDKADRVGLTGKEKREQRREDRKDRREEFGSRIIPKPGAPFKGEIKPETVYAGTISEKPKTTTKDIAKKVGGAVARAKFPVASAIVSRIEQQDDKTQDPVLPKRYGPVLPKQHGPVLPKRQGPELPTQQGPELPRNDTTAQPVSYDAPVQKRTIRTANAAQPTIQQATTTNNVASPFNVSTVGTPFTRQTGGQNLLAFNRPEQDAVALSLRKQLAEQALGEIDEDQLKRDAVRRANAEIRALEALRKDALNQQRRINEQREGTQQAQSARAGLLGSDFGTQAAENVMAYNRELEQGINNAYNLQIQEVLRNADKEANDRIAQLESLKAQGAEGYLEALENEQEIMDEGLINAVTTMIQQGVNPTTLNEELLEEISSKFNATPAKLISTYAQLTSEEGEVGNVGVQGVDPASVQWAEMVRTGQAKLNEVPMDIRKSSGFISALSATEQRITPEQERNLEQASIALTSIKDILDNPALYKGALNRRTVGRIIPGSDTKDLQASMETLKAIIGFEELQSMRDSSPTGGALGQVTEREIALLQALQGNIRLDQSDEQLQQNLNRIKEPFEVIYLVNAPDQTTSDINGIPFTKVGDRLLTEAPDGSIYERRPDGLLEKTSFSQASSINTIDEALENIARVESGGNYNAIGPVVTSGRYKGEQALGKYQVMPGNIPEWSKMALGYSVTPQQFLNSPEIQEAIARDQFSRNFQKYQNWDDVASVWFTGKPLSEAGNVRDVLGTTAQQYVNRFNNIA